MSTKPPFRTPFDSQQDNRFEILLKSKRRHLYHFFSSLCGKWNRKMSLLVLSEILGLFINTMTVDDMYSFPNNENLPQPIQMQLSKKQKNFFSNFYSISKIYIKFWTFCKKPWGSELIYLRNYGLRKSRLDKGLKRNLSEHRSTVNMLNGPKHCCNLQESTFIMFLYQSEQNGAGNCLSYWNLNS